MINPQSELKKKKTFEWVLKCFQETKKEVQLSSTGPLVVSCIIENLHHRIAQSSILETENNKAKTFFCT